MKTAAWQGGGNRDDEVFDGFADHDTPPPQQAQTPSAARLKHLWIQGVCADRRIKGDAARILVYCADRYVMSGEQMFSIKQETVAANLGFKKRQTVGDAFQRGCDLGWLEKYERQRGRGWRVGDAYVLTFPADKNPTAECGDAEEVIGPPPRTYSDEVIGSSSQTYSPVEPFENPSENLSKYVRGDGEIGPHPRQNRSVVTVEIGPHPRHENTSTPAETPDLNDVTEWCNPNDLKAHDFAREHDEPDFSQLFDSLFSNQRNGHEHKTLPAVIDAEVIDTYVERHDSKFRSSGQLSATTDKLVDFEEDRAGQLAKLHAMYPDHDWAAS
jgi:hypothetical protein